MKKIHTIPALLTTAVLALPAAMAAELPKSATLEYSGNLKIPATMNFIRTGNSYKIVSTIKVPLYHIRFESAGTISGNTLQPEYYKETRNGKLYTDVKFNGNNITYGKVGNKKSQTVSGTTMDLFTLAWQLAANDAKLPNNLNVTNGKKIYAVNNMTNAGTSGYKFSGGTTPVTKYVIHRGDNTINYSFATELNNIPAQIVYKEDDGKSYNLRLTRLTIDGKTVKP
ncbi:DUF3108 domain-containing protein [Neisseria iguanae]|uniref:DUF3108 domain-containing protein n=1 Tax=Neisseria iguanae TaxID=90242 RepID=A0A2P7TX66_9NEIS|nr:DUF3108 domain-containing protein [Neisseria iguanae]PSJ79245.1 DUF3108 domain-containing protein [Neisseria iguanae]